MFPTDCATFTAADLYTLKILNIHASPMKTIGLLLLTTFLTLLQADAAAPPPEFIRKPGQYTLDKQGDTTLAITRGPAGQPGQWTLKVTWQSRDATSTSATSVEPENALRAEGWFVYIEQPHRIWVFDGIDSALLLSRTDQETAAKSYPGRALASSPQKFHDALPQPLRTQYPKPAVSKRD